MRRYLRQLGFAPLILLLVLGMIRSPQSFAAKKKSPHHLAVDIVTVKAGQTFRGAVLNRQSDGSLTMAVSRAWLEKADPKEFARQVDRTNTFERDAWSDTKRRIDHELANSPDGSRLVFFLKHERERMEKLLEQSKSSSSSFFLIDVPADHISKVHPAPDDAKKLAILAWNEGLEAVETLPATTLQKQLKEAGVALDGPLPDLSSMLPAQLQSDDEWSARMAIAEYTFTEPLDFQGYEDVLIRTEAGKQINLTAVLPKLLTGQVNTLLGDLLNPGTSPQRNAQPSAETSSLKSAIAIAEKSHLRGFRVTRLHLHPDFLTVGVETSFVAKLSDGTWRTIWQQEESANGAQLRPEEEARIADDPQVKTLLDSLKALGLGDDVAQAVRMGAATMSAQQSAESGFFEFRDRYVDRLDGPPLLVPK